MQSAYELGRLAYKAGKLLSDNPYRGRGGYESLAREWDDGFRDAKDEQ